jgi:hypothetical protein
MPTTRQEVSIIATSKRLVTEFENNRNRADRLRVGAANHLFVCVCQAECDHSK